MLNDIVEVRLDKFLIYSTNELDGYGYQTATDAVSCFNYFSNGKKYNHCLEWCSGPGYLGFATLSQGITKKLTLLDIYKPNKIVVEKTIEKNNLQDAVNFVASNNFSSIDPINKFDLVIGNPPHFAFSPGTNNIDPNEHRKYQDKEWKIHKDFFKNVGKYTTENADIMLMENVKGSNPDTFKEMIKENNFVIKNYCLSVQYPNDIWYIHITKN